MYMFDVQSKILSMDKFSAGLIGKRKILGRKGVQEAKRTDNPKMSFPIFDGNVYLLKGIPNFLVISSSHINIL